MNKKQISLLINKSIESHIPTTMPKIDWDLVNMEPNETIVIEPLITKAKKFLQVKFVLATVFTLVIVLVGLGLLNNQTEIQPVNPYTNLALQDTLSVSAVSTATLMSKYTTTTVSVNQALSLVNKLSSTNTVATIEPYLEMIETITGQNFGISSISSISDNSLYESKVILTSMDLLGNELTYTLYFNTTAYNTRGDQIEFVIEGIFMYRNSQYDFLGKKESDGDKEVITFKTITDSLNYVESSFKTENDESKYYLKIVENGITVSQSKIKVEEEDGNKKIDFEFNDGQNYGQYEFKYDQENGKSILKIEYDTYIGNVEDSGTMKIEIKTDDITGLTSYQIFVKPDDEDEYEYESDRKVEDDHDDYDEDDDEDQPSEDEEDQSSEDDEDQPSEDEEDQLSEDEEDQPLEDEEDQRLEDSESLD